MTSAVAPPTRFRLRRFARLGDGAARMRVLTVTGIATVLLTRAYLAATGYPQVGNGTLHIGHVVWGGLLMIVALTIALVWVGGPARNATALVGGVGVGLFVDEVGKYLTRTDDYFYRPAAAIIYLVFAALLVTASLLDGDGSTRAAGAGERLAEATQIVADGLIGGLTERERDRVTTLLDTCAQDCAQEEREAVRRLLGAVAVRDPGRVARVGSAIRRRAKRLADLPGADAVVFAVLVLSHVSVAIVFAAQALTGKPGTSDAVAISVSALTRSVSALLILVAVCVRLRSRPAAYRLCRSAILVDLLITEAFNFNDSQFGALGELPYLLLAYAYFGHRLHAD